MVTSPYPTLFVLLHVPYGIQIQSSLLPMIEVKIRNQRNLKGTIDFLQKRDIPYTLRCTPLSYEVVPQPQLFKDKGIPNGFVEMEKRQER
ncbi:hypothetical protein JHK82_029643 [Glycine max]|nr:hypothetical protein JHK86_057237 [Glycine max]KAG4906006.1 hypothetical protein JHK86_057253 [Glycine max]KAG4987265.1 hypothetical protein JHK86_034956 [Glycine max]KAG5044571.1 hypothetical protein JHK86_013977 [Glycine max]KAG5103855.1 hypothetical protein JHK82_040825 [Glycine max]